MEKAAAHTPAACHMKKEDDSYTKPFNGAAHVLHQETFK